MGTTSRCPWTGRPTPSSRGTGSRGTSSWSRYRVAARTSSTVTSRSPCAKQESVSSSSPRGIPVPGLRRRSHPGPSPPSYGLYDVRAMDHAARRVRLASRLPELEVDALLITRLPNVRYLTGFTGSNGQLLLTASEARFFTDGRYEEQARHEVPDVARDIRPHTAIPKAFADAARDAGARRMGFEADGVTYRTYEQLAERRGPELVPVQGAVEGLRQAKDPEEI